jgi:hypothetical protein
VKEFFQVRTAPERSSGGLGIRAELSHGFLSSKQDHSAFRKGAKVATERMTPEARHERAKRAARASGSSSKSKEEMRKERWQGAR